MEIIKNLPPYMRPKQFCDALGFNRYFKQKFLKEIKGNHKIIRGQTGVGRRPLLDTKAAWKYITKQQYL